MQRTSPFIATVMIAAGLTHAQPTVDGTLDGSYGAALAVQTVQTNFGNSTATSAGSELDAAYATVDNGRLYLMITGNLEDNFNKFELFFDSVAGGENVLSDMPEYDFTANLGDADPFYISQNLGGLTFDAGFEADYHLFARDGAGNFEVDFVNRAGGTSAAVAANKSSALVNVGADRTERTAAGVITPADLPATPEFGNISGATLSENLEFGFDNANEAGINGGTQAADQSAALAVTTGLEFSIALTDLGIDPQVGGQIKVSAFVNNGDHNFASNQFLGGLTPPQDNLGGDGSGGFTGTLSGVDLTQFTGDQFFTINVPGAQIPGDANGDGQVTGADLSILDANFGMAGGFAQGDFNGDGEITGADLSILDANFGAGVANATSAAVTAVPEPASIAMIGLGGLALLRRRPA